MDTAPIKQCPLSEVLTMTKTIYLEDYNSDLLEGLYTACDLTHDLWTVSNDPALSLRKLAAWYKKRHGVTVSIPKAVKPEKEDATFAMQLLDLFAGDTRAVKFLKPYTPGQIKKGKIASSTEVTNMATKKNDFTTLTEYLNDADLSGVTAVALDRAITAALRDGLLIGMTASTDNNEKYMILDGEIKIGMPTKDGGKAGKGYQAYRSDYLIDNEDAFHEWYTTTFKTAAKNRTVSKTVYTIAELKAMTSDERQAYQKRLLDDKLKSSENAKNTVKVKDRLIKIGTLIASERFAEAQIAMQDVQTRSNTPNATRKEEYQQHITRGLNKIANPEAAKQEEDDENNVEE